MAGMHVTPHSYTPKYILPLIYLGSRVSTDIHDEEERFDYCSIIAISHKMSLGTGNVQRSTSPLNGGIGLSINPRSKNLEEDCKAAHKFDT